MRLLTEVAWNVEKGTGGGVQKSGSFAEFINGSPLRILIGENCSPFTTALKRFTSMKIKMAWNLTSEQLIDFSRQWQALNISFIVRDYLEASQAHTFRSKAFKNFSEMLPAFLPKLRPNSPLENTTSVVGLLCASAQDFASELCCQRPDPIIRHIQ